MRCMIHSYNSKIISLKNQSSTVHVACAAEAVRETPVCLEQVQICGVMQYKSHSTAAADGLALGLSTSHNGTAAML
jgi:hypothetical protein